MIIDSYARESRRGDARQRSVTGQHAANLERIAALGGTLGKKLDDQGKSAWRKGVKRPDWETALHRLDTGQSHGVMIYDVARLIRLVEDAVRIVRLAERGFLIYDHAMTYDLTTTSGRSAFYDKAVAAETYSSETSDKVKRGHRLKAEQGEGHRGRFRAFGFEDDSTTVNEHERPHIRKVAQMILKGAKWNEACDYLTSQGIMSTSVDHEASCREKKAGLTVYQQKRYTCECPHPPWGRNQLRRAMTNPVMAGYMKLGNEIVGNLPGEPILDPSDWQEMVMTISKRRLGRPPHDKALCSGRSPVRCGYDEGVIGSRNYPKERYYKDGEHKRIYFCTTCHKVIADQRELDKAVTVRLIADLSTKERIDHLQERAKETSTKRQVHEKEIARLEGVRDYWDGKLNDGDIEPKRHDKLTADLDAKIRIEQAKLKEVGSPDAVPARRTRKSLEEEWAKMTMDMRRQWLHDAYVDSVIFVQPGTSMDSYKDILEGRLSVEPKPKPQEEGRPHSE